MTDRNPDPTSDGPRRVSRLYAALLVGAMLAIASLLIWLLGPHASSETPTSRGGQTASEQDPTEPTAKRPSNTPQQPTPQSNSGRQYLEGIVVEAEGERLVLQPLQPGRPSVTLLVRHDALGSFDQAHMRSHITSREPAKVLYETLNGRRFVISERSE